MYSRIKEKELQNYSKSKDEVEAIIKKNRIIVNRIDALKDNGYKVYHLSCGLKVGETISVNCVEPKCVIMKIGSRFSYNSWFQEQQPWVLLYPNKE